MKNVYYANNHEKTTIPLAQTFNDQSAYEKY